MANEFKVKKGLIVQGSGSTVLDIQGSQGQLFSVTDSLSGSLFSVNDISGVPIMEVFSDNRVNLGTFNAEAIKVSGSFATMTGSLFGTSSWANNATSASFASTSSYLNSTTNAFIQNGNSFGTTALLGTNDNQPLALETSGSTRMFISSSGNVGIGTTSPSEKLDVNGNVKAIGFKTPTGTSTQFLMADGSTNSNTYAKTDGTNASGNWGISITGNAATATKLQTARNINGTSFNGSADINVTEWIHSNRDFVNGTLITTDIDYSVTNGSPFIVQIRGNSYGSSIPFDIQLQGYIYNNTIINSGGYSTGPTFNIIAMNVGGNLCFWFARQSYWQGFNVHAYSALGSRAVNRVQSITDVSNPNGSKQVTFTPVQVLRSDNYNSYTPTLTGGNASGTWGISITGNATTATTLQTARTINGTSFNGSANITTANWGTSRTITIGATGKTVDGSGNVSWTLAEIGAQAALTNPITGTATSGQVAFFNGTTTQTGDTNLFWDNTNKRLGIGTTTPSGKLDVNGNTNINGTLTATVKSFIIDHPTKQGKKLQYGVLEGPEHSVYVRGKLTNNNTITLPDHWTGLVHEDTITVNLTPIGKKQDLWVETVTDTTITVGSDNEINCYYTVFAERKDIEKLVTEYDK